MLGDELFKKCLHAYMDRWHGKHPTPWDFFYTYNDVAGKNMNWFWTNWFFTNNYIDLAIDGVKDANGQGTVVGIHNIGGFAIPFDIEAHYTDGSTRSFHQTPAVWSNDQQHVSITIATDGTKKLASLVLNGGIYVDADASNNKWVAN
jgi:aminopeptidase N